MKDNLSRFWFCPTSCSGKMILSLLLLWLAVPVAHSAETILNSKHNLSATSTGNIRATKEAEVCIFCHTPHGSGREAPLWNRYSSGATYLPYSSTTTKATIGQPTGSSKLCLSCHDGTVALGMVRSRETPLEMQAGITTMPHGRSLIGTDLSDDHPISFVYDSALAARSSGLKDPLLLTGRVRLDDSGQMQCTSCHDPHNNEFGKFLVQNNYASALCVTCHSPNHWNESSHKSSLATWNGEGTDPWPHSDETTVAANACASCHAPHAAGTKPRLLNHAVEEQNCFVCHNGSVARDNMQVEFGKFSVHPVISSTGIHDAAEDLINPARHSTCVDCHNPHASRTASAVAPNASGAINGVAGVNSVGVIVPEITRQSELCYRCHADSVARGPALIPRENVETNTRMEFNGGNMSFHPVETVGKNNNVPSLISPYTTATMMYCTDCHNNNEGPGSGGTGPNGPHGSIYRPILERQLVLTDFTTETSASYALCYKCHSRDSILGDASFKGHRSHVVDHQTSCVTCHDPHGVQSRKALVNFNRTYVTPSSNGRIDFTSTGIFRGNCSLTCHGKDHDALSYGM